MLSKRLQFDFVKINVDIFFAFALKVTAASASLLVMVVVSDKWGERVAADFFSWLSLCAMVAVVSRFGSEQKLFFRVRDGEKTKNLLLLFCCGVFGYVIFRFIGVVGSVGVVEVVPALVSALCVVSISAGYFLSELLKARERYILSQLFQTGFFYISLLGAVLLFGGYVLPYKIIIYSSLLVLFVFCALSYMYYVRSRWLEHSSKLYDINYALVNFSSVVMGWGLLFIASCVVPQESRLDTMWHLRLMALFFLIPSVVNAKYAVEFSHGKSLNIALKEVLVLALLFLVLLGALPLVSAYVEKKSWISVGSFEYGISYYMLIAAYFVNCIGSVVGAFGSLSGRQKAVSYVSLAQCVFLFSLLLFPGMSSITFSIIAFVAFSIKVFVLRRVVHSD